MPVHDWLEPGRSGANCYGRSAQYQSGIADRACRWVCHLRITLQTSEEGGCPMSLYKIVGSYTDAEPLSLPALESCHRMRGGESPDFVTSLVPEQSSSLFAVEIPW